VTSQLLKVKEMLLMCGCFQASGCFSVTVCLKAAKVTRWHCARHVGSCPRSSLTTSEKLGNFSFPTSLTLLYRKIVTLETLAVERYWEAI
jgi:hypothetical protein